MRPLLLSRLRTIRGGAPPPPGFPFPHAPSSTLPLQVFWRLGDGFDAVRNRINLLFVQMLQFMLLVSEMLCVCCVCVYVCVDARTCACVCFWGRTEPSWSVVLIGGWWARTRLAMIPAGVLGAPL